MGIIRYIFHLCMKVTKYSLLEFYLRYIHVSGIAFFVNFPNWTFSPSQPLQGCLKICRCFGGPIPTNDLLGFPVNLVLYSSNFSIIGRFPYWYIQYLYAVVQFFHICLSINWLTSLISFYNNEVQCFVVSLL